MSRPILIHGFSWTSDLRKTEITMRVHRTRRGMRIASQAFARRWKKQATRPGVKELAICWSATYSKCKMISCTMLFYRGKFDAATIAHEATHAVEYIVKRHVERGLVKIPKGWTRSDFMGEYRATMVGELVRYALAWKAAGYDRHRTRCRPNLNPPA